MSLELTDEQIYATMDLENWWNRKHSKQIFEISGAAGTGKAQPVDTIIPVPDGFKRFGDLKVGDFVFNRHGNPVKVIGVYDRGELDAYIVTLDDGRSTICNSDHLWTVITENKKLCVKSLEEILNEGILMDDHMTPRFKIPMHEAVQYSHKEFTDDPYIVGTTIIDDKESSIPTEYFYGDINQRWDLIQGIFDSAGYIDNENNDISYTNQSYNVVVGIKQILLSLGILSYIKAYSSIVKHGRDSVKFLLSVECDNWLKSNFFRLEKKKRIAAEIEDIPNERDYNHTYISNVVKLSNKMSMRCIKVDDPEGLYLTNNYIVTHNTTIIRYFIERIGLSFDEVLFTSFCGKAVSQMARNGLPAKTIHSAIYNYVEVYDTDENGHYILKENGKFKKTHKFELKPSLPNKIKLIVIDEASMVGEKLALDLLSFGIPTVCLGDLNQLPPVMDKSFFLKNPDVILTKIMRQKENDPIVWLSQEILKGRELQYGVYGNSAVIRRGDVTEFNLKNADIIITGTNRLRTEINNKFREEIRGYTNLDVPHINEKVVCKRNDWSREIDDGIYLTNGTTGFIDGMDKSTYNGYSMVIDFKPDFINKVFNRIKIDYYHLFNKVPDDKHSYALKYLNLFEFAYAITCHTSQGGGWDSVLFMAENFFKNGEDRKRFMYTGITRAISQLILVK